MNIEQQYSEYLQNRSFLAGIYRRYYLYPKLKPYLKGRLLDVGCGIGDMLVYYPDSAGTDINPVNVAYCLQRGCEAYEMAADQLPFADASFDAVVLDNVLEHIAAPAPLLKEIKRVLRRDGVVLIGVPGIKGQSSDPDHKVFYDETALQLLADNAGFIVSAMLHAPLWKSDVLSRKVRQYCVYTQWTLKN